MSHDKCSVYLLILSHNRRNLELLTQVLERANYRVIATKNYGELEKALANSARINLGLIDLLGCDRHIWNYCDRLQTRNIPFLTFIPQHNPIVKRNSLVHGASSVLVKPLEIKNLLLLINSLIDKPE